MVFGKGARIAFSQFGVIATTPFGNIMEEGSQDNNPVFIKACDQVAAEWKLMRMLKDHETSYITQDHQDVLINGVYMK